MKARGKRTPVTPCKACGYTGVRRTDRINLSIDECLIQCPRCKAMGKIGNTVENAVLFWNQENSKEGSV